MREQGQTKNLGQIAAVWISPNAPENLRLIWYDTHEQIHKVYETTTGEWIALNPQVVTNSTISDLRVIAQDSGLSFGKFYYLTDVGTLAVAITTTKIWYVDALNNYVVNDLAANITAYINSDNLLIDGSTGVWNNATGRLEFVFSEVATGTGLQTANDYIVIRRKNGTAWSWIKAKLSSFVSAVSGNSITWNGGFYFNLSTAIDVLKNVSGGVVGYDRYSSDTEAINQAIANVAQGNAEILDASKTYTNQKTSASALLDTIFSRPWVIYQNPPQVPGIGSKLFDVLSILISWTQLLQNSSKIKIGSGFSPNGRSGEVNYSDTVRAAIEKLVYKVTQNLSVPTINTSILYLLRGFRIQMVDSLGNNSTTLSFNVSNNMLVLNNAGKETAIITALLRIGLGQKSIQFTTNGIIPITGFDYNGNADDIAQGDTIERLIEKLIYKVNQLTINLDFSIWAAKFLNDDWYTMVAVGDKIGEFDSQGRPLYTATLEGAVYLLGAWYMSHFDNVSSIWGNVNAYYMSGRGDGRTESYQTCQYRIFENTLAIKCSSVTTIFTYMGNESHDILIDNNTDDVTLTFRNIPQWAIERLIAKYGANTPFTLGISVVGRSNSLPGFVARGMMYGIIVHTSQDYINYLKFIPYWTDAVEFQSGALSGQAVNENGLFGTDWIVSSIYQGETWDGKISPFCVEIPLF